MGILVDGIWREDGPAASGSGGRFVRDDAHFRNWITRDGAPGPTGAGGFRAEAGRYQLYVSHACPWAHRTVIFRVLKGLEDMVGLSVVNWHMGPDGWTFEPGPGVVADPVMGARTLHDLYLAENPRLSGRATTPLLWDKARGRIVSNESAEIIRMFNGAFDAIGATPGDFYPPALRGEIDALNALVYDRLNNGVYKAGFASTQAAYDEAVVQVFAMLDALEPRLARSRYLFGDRITEADWRLFTTLVRFDAVYAGHFKCNLRRLVDYPNLWAYARDLYQVPGVAGTVHLDHIKNHYYGSHARLNPSGIVPIGPEIDFAAPHGRDRLSRR
jgi:putative glutathione S-transferase